MKNETALKNADARSTVSDEILKATALLYLDEALRKEVYEDCTELIGIARKFGANKDEIDNLIFTSIRGIKRSG